MFAVFEVMILPSSRCQLLLKTCLYRRKCLSYLVQDPNLLSRKAWSTSFIVLFMLGNLYGWGIMWFRNFSTNPLSCSIIEILSILHHFVGATYHGSSSINSWVWISGLCSSRDRDILGNHIPSSNCSRS